MLREERRLRLFEEDVCIEGVEERGEWVRLVKEELCDLYQISSG
jgi:hypothetical protein